MIGGIIGKALRQVGEMEKTLERLEKRCKLIIKGSTSYKDTVQGLSGSQMHFADSLEEFCGGTDEESMLLGTQAVRICCDSA